MTDDIHKITIQLQRPSGKFPGKIAEGWYCVNADSFVVLTDAVGKPLGTEKHHVDPGGDAKLIACRMLRRHQNAKGGGDFNAPIRYPKIGY